MKRAFAFALIAALLIGLLPAGVFPTASAATSGIYTYTVSGGKATITDCDESASGAITIPSKLGGYPVTAIGTRAFYCCRKLTSVTIPDSVTTIGSDAFTWCWNLTSITIPDSVTTIGNGAFNDCDSLTSVTIPDSVTSIGWGAFYECDSLTGIWVDENNPAYSSDAYGVLFYKDKRMLLLAPSGMQGSYTIPDGVTSMATDAFYACKKLSSVTIPDSVTSIGDMAFYECDGLTSITIPDSVTSIGDSAFWGCNRLTSIIIPDSVTSIKYEAFFGCPITDVYYGGTQAQWDAITIGSNNEDLTNATLHVSTASVKDLTFDLNADGVSWSVYACKSDASGSLVIPATYEGLPITAIGFGAFYDCDSLTSVTIPRGVTSIGQDAFAECDNLVSVTIPDSVTSIGTFAFYNCNKLISLHIPSSVMRIDQQALRNCDNLTGIWVDEKNTVFSSDGRGVLFNKAKTELLQAPGGMQGSYTIPSSVTAIGMAAFAECAKLTAVTIPDSVTYIDFFAFSYCSSLTSVTIPDSVTSVEFEAFRGCDNLTGIWVDEKNTEYSNDACGVLFNKNKTDLLQAPGGMQGSYTIPDGVDYVNSYAFAECDKLTSVIIPEGVSDIADYAFDDCTGLTSVTIPGSVTSIGYNAFDSCDRLTDVYYGGTQAQWGKINIRSNNKCLTSATLHCQPAQIVPECLTYEIKDGKVTITDCDESAAGELVIPSTIEGYPVTAIGNEAFGGCYKLTSITIPDSVTTIGNSAFRDCSKLTSITIPSSVTSIGDGAFYFACDLTGIWVDEKNPAYSNDACGVLFNKNKTELLQAPGGMQGGYMIPSSVTKIGMGAFSECDTLTAVTIPRGVTSIGDWAFAACDNLASVTIPDSVTTIGDYAFQNCYNLTAVTIPNSVTSIGDAAFAECDNLTGIWVDEKNTVFSSDGRGVLFNEAKTELLQAPGGMQGSYTIPDSVTSIGDFVFGCCHKLVSITIPDSVTSIGDGAFYYCNSLTSITIPDSVTYIGYEAFYVCHDLTDVYYGGTQAQWDAIDIGSDNEYLTNATLHCQPAQVAPECLTYEIKDGKVTITDCDTSATGELEIPATHQGLPVTAIGNRAFADCVNLTSVTIPDGVTSIGSDAFYACDGLTSVTIPDSVTTIGDSAFTWCHNLTSITIPDSVSAIGNDTFYHCDNLTSVRIGDGVSAIGKYAFAYCTSLASVTIPDGVITIGQSAFYGCNKLTSVTIPGSVTTIDAVAFWRCDLLADVYYDGTRAQWDAITIGSDNQCLTNAALHLHTLTFKRNSDGTGYTVTDCDALATGNLTIPATYQGLPVTGIGSKAFADCVKLTSIIIPDSVTTIGENVFYNCTGLAYNTYDTGLYLGSKNNPYRILVDTQSLGITSCTIHPDTSIILDYAFGYCSKLTTITIPASVEKIGNQIFIGCIRLQSIRVESGNPIYSSDAAGVLLNKDQTTLISAPAALAGHYVMPQSVTRVKGNSFANCTALTAITLPGGLVNVGSAAFAGCTALKNVYFDGTKAQWTAMTIGSGNEALTKATLQYILFAQQPDGTLTLKYDGEQAALEIAAGQVLDLGGHVLTVENLACFGQIIDSVGGGGLIAGNMEISGNDWLPILDSTGCYRFYEYEVANLGAKGGAQSAVFGFALDFADAAAYTTLLQCEDLQVTFTLTVGGTTKTYAFSRELIARYAKLQVAFPNMQAAMKLQVTGLDSVADGTVIAVTPAITAVGGKIQNSGDATEYIA